MILFPLSPDYLAILYDRRCYRVGAPGKRTIPLSSVSDLIALNNHQFLNASENLYHREESLAPKHLAEFSRVTNLRNENRQIVRDVPISPGRSLLHMFTEPINYRPPTSFMKIQKARRAETDPVSRIPERNLALAQQFMIYSEGVRTDAVPRGFVGYLARIASVVLSEEQKAAWTRSRGGAR